MSESITQKEFEARLRNETNPGFVSLTVVQPARLRKRGNPFGECSKVTFQVSGVFCIKYGQARRNRLEKLGQTKAARTFPFEVSHRQRVLPGVLVSNSFEAAAG